MIAVVIASVALGASQARPVHAYAADRMIEGAKLCTKYLPKQEREHGIPVHLLAAIASTESGRWHKGLKMPLPWPWTINAEGRGQFFETKQDAIAEVKRLLASGVKSIDVGCMQVNLRHHPNAFQTLNEAFEPRTNVAYAAKFLKSNFDELGSWKKAAAAYHSRTPQFGNRYIGIVYNSWRRIINEVRAAKAGKLVNAQMGTTDALPLNKQTASLTTDTGDESIRRTGSARKPTRMKVIELSKKDRRRENGVMVIRPQGESTEAAEQGGAKDVKVKLTPASDTMNEKPKAAKETEVASVQEEAPAEPVKNLTPAEELAKQREMLKRLEVMDAANAELSKKLSNQKAVSTGQKPAATAPVQKKEAAPPQKPEAIRMQGEVRRVMPEGNLASKHEADTGRKTGPRFIFD